MRKITSVLCVLVVMLGVIALTSCKQEPEADYKSDYAEYKIGDTSPAGGYIFYDCDADNKSGNADGLTSRDCGWRYLEAAPADLRIVNGLPTVDDTQEGYSTGTECICFGFYRKKENGKSLFVNGTGSYDVSNCTGRAIGTGKSNTQLLVAAMGELNAYGYRFEEDYIYGQTDEYAARLCDILTYTFGNKTYDDWFLPSKDELNLMYLNLFSNGLGGFTRYNYWSSSEDGSSAGNACGQYFGDGSQGFGHRNSLTRVRPVRAF